MKGGEAAMHERADELRQAFDRSFALAPQTGTDTTLVENLLAVRVGPLPYGLRLMEVSGLFVDRKVTWLPSAVPELLGIVGLRGALLPVYDLGMLLGCPRGAAPRWLLVTAGMAVGLAFDSFDGYLRVRPETIVPEVRGESGPRHVREVLQSEIARPIVHLPSVIQTIKSRGGYDRQT
jgi:chemotaxis signal transduction protein